MEHFQNILCLVDSSAKSQIALHRAAELAHRNGANLKIVDVVDDTPTWFGMMLKVDAGALEQHHEQLRNLAESVRSRVPAVTTELLHGRPTHAVVREVLRHGFDLVIKDARGTSQHKPLLFGSVDIRLMRNCPCPVWLNMPDHGRSHGVVLAAIDPLISDDAHKSINETILELASSLSVHEDSELHVISAWDSHGESMLAGRISYEQMLEYASEHHQAAKQGLATAVERFRPCIDRHRVQLRKGEPADVIVSYAKEIQCDLLMMGTVARGIPGLLMGNTADTVLRQIECSVVTVKPDGFVSPVKPD